MSRLWMFLTVLLMLVACDKAPNGVIKESKMVNLMADMYKAEAYIEAYGANFTDDSTKLALKQSIFAKHGVTSDEYDASLEWYAHHMDAYTDVCRRTMEKLSNESDKLNKQGTHDNAEPQMAQMPEMNASHHDGDDLWKGRRTWMLTPGMKNGCITFEVNAPQDMRIGDAYELAFKAAHSAANSMRVFFAADYNDGSTSYLSRKIVPNGWNHINLQTDTSRTVTRIYGYINYNLTMPNMAMVDSLQLLRTRFNASLYHRGGTQKMVERNKQKVAQEKNENATVDLRTGIIRDKDGQFKPKEGLNKSSAPAHIEQSPNAKHLPSAR